MSHAVKGHIWKKLKPTASSSQAAVCCHIQGVESMNVSPQPGPFSAGTKVLDSPCAHTPFPQFRAAVAEVKSGKILPCFSTDKWKLCVKKYLVLQVTANSDHRQSPHSEVKPRFIHQIKQKHTRVTWSHQTDIFSSLIQERTNLLFLPGPLLVYTKPCTPVTKMTSWGKTNEFKLREK